MPVLKSKPKVFTNAEKQQLVEAVSQIQKQLDFSPVIKHFEESRMNLVESFRIYQQKFFNHWAGFLQEYQSAPLERFVSTLKEISDNYRKQILEMLPLSHFSMSNTLYNPAISSSTRLLDLDANVVQHPHHGNNFGIYLRPDGGFEHKGRLLHVSIDNKQGKFFIKSLQLPFNFVSDKFCSEKLFAKDYRQIGIIIRDLNRDLKKDGVKAEYVRRKEKNGYTLVAVKELN